MSASRQKQGAVSREDLMAYADGLLDHRHKARIEAWLREHPQESALVRSWQAQNEAFDALYPRHEARRRASAISGRAMKLAPAWPRQLAAALILLAIGIGSGWLAHGMIGGQSQIHVAGLVEEAMAAHAVYASEVLHPVEVKATQEKHLVAWLSKRLGARIVAPDLSASGYRLMGGRLLPAGERAAAQFMYEDDAGRRITIFAAPAPKGQLAAFEFDEKDGLAGIYWRDEALEYAVVGPLDRESLMNLAGEIYRQLI